MGIKPKSIQTTKMLVSLCLPQNIVLFQTHFTRSTFLQGHPLVPYLWRAKWVLYYLFLGAASSWLLSFLHCKAVVYRFPTRILLSLTSEPLHLLFSLFKKPIRSTPSPLARSHLPVSSSLGSLTLPPQA